MRGGEKGKYLAFNESLATGVRSENNKTNGETDGQGKATGER